MSTTRVISNWKYHFQHFGRLYLVIHTGRTVFWTASVAERTRLNPNIAWVYLQTKYPLSCQNIRKKWTHTRKSFCDFHVGYRGSLIPNFGTFIFSKNLVYRTKQVCTCVSCTLCTVDLIRLWIYSGVECLVGGTQQRHHSHKRGSYIYISFHGRRAALKVAQRS